MRICSCVSYCAPKAPKVIAFKINTFGVNFNQLTPLIINPFSVNFD